MTQSRRWARGIRLLIISVTILLTGCTGIKYNLYEKAVANEAINRKIFKDLHKALPYAFSDAIEKITAPSLILWGAEDRVIHVNNASIFVKQIPNSQTVILAGVGHAPMIEVPEESAKKYIDFIDSL